MLTDLYATGARKVPAGAPVGFVPAKWAGYLVAAEQAGDVTVYRRCWALAVLAGLRDGLRSGDVFVPGSRRYADPASFLLTTGAWAPQKVEFCHLVGKPVEAADALAQADDELPTALTDLETQLAKGNPSEVRLTDDGELIIPPLPAEADAPRAELAGTLVEGGRVDRVHRSPGPRRRKGRPADGAQPRNQLCYGSSTAGACPSWQPAAARISMRCGLGSAANLRLHFRRTYTTTPLAYRSTFQQR